MTAKEEAELIMNEGIEFAQRMLSEHGEFFPFGVALLPDGTIVHAGADVGTEHPPSKVVLETLIDGFRMSASRGEYKAIGLFLDVLIRRPVDGLKVDAVQAGLEHKEEYSADVFFPYTLSDGEVHFGEMFAQQREPVVFR